MEIIRELKNNLKMRNVKEIYANGGKIAIEFSKKRHLGHIDFIEGLPTGVEILTVNGIIIDTDGDVYAEGGFKILVDNVFEDVANDVADVVVFKDGYSKYVLPCCLYMDDDNSIIADKVYEVVE